MMITPLDSSLYGDGDTIWLGDDVGINSGAFLTLICAEALSNGTHGAVMCRASKFLQSISKQIALSMGRLMYTKSSSTLIYHVLRSRYMRWR